VAEGGVLAEAAVEDVGGGGELAEGHVAGGCVVEPVEEGEEVVFDWEKGGELRASEGEAGEEGDVIDEGRGVVNAEGMPAGGGEG
jgi:hypothetical protein